MSKNDITGDDIKSKANSVDYLDGWERIFGKANLGRYPPTPDQSMESETKQKEQDESTD